MGIGHALDVASFVGIMMDWAKLFSFWFMMIYIVMSFVPMYINICNISPLHPVIYDISPQAISIYIYIYHYVCFKISILPSQGLPRAESCLA
jgi:ABC-type transport system involved in Fe-S cluster assembly fused permease/ATPase subunit